LVEQRIRNAKVVGSTPISGTTLKHEGQRINAALRVSRLAPNLSCVIPDKRRAIRNDCLGGMPGPVLV